MKTFLEVCAELAEAQKRHAEIKRILGMEDWELLEEEIDEWLEKRKSKK